VLKTKQDGFLSILTNHTKKIEAGLGALFPTTFVPVYTMIAFRDMPYDETLRRAHQQEVWVSRLIALMWAFSGCALLVLPDICGVHIGNTVAESLPSEEINSRSPICLNCDTVSSCFIW
jgi:hypothetical protein